MAPDDQQLEQEELRFEELRQIIKDVADGIQQVSSAMAELPKNIADVIPTPELSVTTEAKLSGDDIAEVLNFKGLSDYMGRVAEAIESLLSKQTDTVTVANASDMKADIAPLAKAIGVMSARLDALAKKQIKVEVPPAQAIVWPKKPADAIPVVLVDRTLTRFYDAIARAVSSGGGIQSTLISSGSVKVVNPDGSAIGSIPAEVEVKNDSGNPVPVTQAGIATAAKQDEQTTLLTPPITPTVTSVADTASSTMLKAANAARKEIEIQNTSSAVLYIKKGTTASATDFTARLEQYGYYTTDYTGRIDGIWASDPGDGAAIITESV